MEYFLTNETIGIRTHKNNNIIQIEFNKNNDIIIFNINESQLIIDRQYIINNITPNFTVEMLYNVFIVLIKYDNFNLIKDNNYIYNLWFIGCYHEPYDQGDEIYIKIVLN